VFALDKVGGQAVPLAFGPDLRHEAVRRWPPLRTWTQTLRKGTVFVMRNNLKRALAGLTINRRGAGTIDGDQVRDLVLFAGLRKRSSWRWKNLQEVRKVFYTVRFTRLTVEWIGRTDTAVQTPYELHTRHGFVCELLAHIHHE
jgi:hypothetical protein